MNKEIKIAICQSTWTCKKTLETYRKMTLDTDREMDKFMNIPNNKEGLNKRQEILMQRKKL